MPLPKPFPALKVVVFGLSLRFLVLADAFLDLVKASTESVNVFLDLVNASRVSVGAFRDSTKAFTEAVKTFTDSRNAFIDLGNTLARSRNTFTRSKLRPKRAKSETVWLRIGGVLRGDGGAGVWDEDLDRNFD